MTDRQRRNPQATSAAILASARRAFAASGYDGAGVRVIAAGADVTAMMVNHYFGSKEQLFAAVLTQVMEEPAIVTPAVLGSPDPARALAAALVASSESMATPLDGFLIVLKSATNPRAAAICREHIERYHQRQMESVVPGPDVAARAAVVLSLVAGFQLMRQMYALPALTGIKADDLVGILAEVLSPLVVPPSRLAARDPSRRTRRSTD